MFPIYERREDTSSQLTALFFPYTSLILSAALCNRYNYGIVPECFQPIFLLCLTSAISNFALKPSLSAALR